MGDSIYYINTGTKKGDSDVKRVTHFMKKDMFGEIVNVTKEITKEYNKLKKLAKQGDESAQLQLGISTENTKAMNISDFVSKYHKECYEEDEIIFNCILLPNNIVEDEEPHYCDEDFEYNVDKYITMFNNRIKPQLVCFDKNIRIKKVTNKKGELVEENNIIIDNPKDRKYFTEEECKLVSGQPYKPSDQDTYEQLMTMEDKEIRFWISVNKRPIYEKECGMDWDAIKQEYLDRQEKLKQEGIKDEVELYRKIINSLTNDDIELLTEEGEIPNEILKICDFNPNNGSFISKTWNIKIGEIWEILDKKYDEVAEFINDLVSDAKIDVSNV
jgi:hypothetical protein